MSDWEAVLAGLGVGVIVSIIGFFIVSWLAGA